MPPPRRLYFHGLPGGPGELDLFPRGPNAPTDRVERQVASSGPTSHFQSVADALQRRFPAEPLHLVGFSLGAAAALRTARHLGPQVVAIDLVSAAAPLQLGDFLDAMAGGPLFRLAAASPTAFAAAARLQSWAVRIAPGRLFDTLFATARGADAPLAADPAFRAALHTLLAESFTSARPLYRREIGLYVADWADELAGVEAPVTLHHGRDDNWTPPAMAEALARALPHCAGLHTADGLSHYSTLRAFLAA